MERNNHNLGQQYRPLIKIDQSAFPRSGTNTLNIGLSLCFPNHTVNAPSYSPKTIKNGDNTFVIFRNPVDSIASWAHYSDYMRQTVTLDALIEWWAVFAKTALESSEKIFMTTFDLLMTNHHYVFEQYAKKFNVENPQNISKKIIDLKVKKDFPNSFPRPQIVIPPFFYLQILESKKYEKANKLYLLIKDSVNNKCC